MTLKRPPVLATLLLTWLGCSPNNEAVVGDLHERYQNRQSTAWYWRQTLSAIARSVFSEICGHKLWAAYSLSAGWATSILICWMWTTVASVGARTHHACTLLWIFAGIASGCSVGLSARRSKRAPLLLYLSTIWMFLIFLHPAPQSSYRFVYWADGVVLTASVVFGALPALSTRRQSSTAMLLLPIALFLAISQGRLFAGQTAPLGAIQGRVIREGSTEPLPGVRMRRTRQAERKPA